MFIQAKLCKANAGHDQGDLVKLMQFVAQDKVDLQVTYKNLTPMPQEDKKVEVAHSNPKVVSHTISTAFANMDQEWMALCAQTKLEGFYIAVQGMVEDLSELKVFFTPKADNFVWTVLDIEPHHLVLCLRSWVVSGLEMCTVTKDQCPLNKLVSKCCSLIQEDLDYLLTKKKVKAKVKMNYTNYEHQIVECYGDMLTGWSCSGRVQNPLRVGRQAEVEKLLNALNSEACNWVRLTDAELRVRITYNKECQA
ncbi:hypothetical protein EDC04DRAFT_2606471 [Pisolithus marmoratus]|nr:hypothetical protein EDC04DRAFT_2606471 [Pisolithus marmoratus]